MATQTETSSKLMSVADYIALPPVSADQRFFYGSEPMQFADLYLPHASGPHPLLILLHGGCWRAQYGLEPLGLLCKAFVEEGFAVWNVEYRRLGNGGGWPMTFMDVAQSVDYLRSIAEQHALDLSRVVSIGHSAGGHLALWLAARHRLPAASALYMPDPLPIQGVVALAGVVDLAEGVKRQMCGGACQELLGDSAEAFAQRYQQASPKELLPLGVEQWHIVGSEDPIVTVDYLQQYVAFAAQYDSVRLDVVQDAGHFEVAAPATLAWASVRQAVRTLLVGG